MPILRSDTLTGAPLALYGGSPATVLPLAGIVLRSEAVETFGDASIVPAGQARFGEPLIADGITVWLEGSFPSDARGGPVALDRADILESWEALHELLISSNYELFLHYGPGDDPLYRKHTSMTTVLIRTRWADPQTLHYQVAAITTSHALSTTEPGS